MKVLRFFLKLVLVLLVLAGIGGGVFYYMNHRPVPDSVQSTEADKLAEKMLEALNYKALQNTRYLKWKFNGSNAYLYDRDLGIVNVKWDINEVELFLNEPDRNTAFVNGTEVEGKEERESLASEALKKFNNDSFWLLGPYKIFEEGVKRSVVEVDDGSKGLMVEYTTGGDTPGDKYLWLLNDSYFPYACRMWVQILPVGGTEASWDDWMVTETGAYLPKSHKMLTFTIDMGEVDGFNERPKP